MNFTRRGLIISAAATLATPSILRAAQGDGPIFTFEGQALRGTDPVAYFNQSAVVRGHSDLSTRWMGSTWCFANDDNREAFEMNPRKYAPQYGGYCAYAASKGGIAPTDPEAWTIVDGKLYLNFSLTVRDIWSGDIPGNIAKADANWPGLLEGLTG